MFEIHFGKMYENDNWKNNVYNEYQYYLNLKNMHEKLNWAIDKNYEKIAIKLLMIDKGRYRTPDLFLKAVNSNNINIVNAFFNYPFIDINFIKNNSEETAFIRNKK
jgi:hypothetical protein